MVYIDHIHASIKIDNQELILTKREYDLFRFLYENKGKTCTRDLIQSIIWRDYYTDRAIDTTIARLRKKLPSTIRLETRRGFGYTLL